MKERLWLTLGSRFEQFPFSLFLLPLLPDGVCNPVRDVSGLPLPDGVCNPVRDVSGGYRCRTGFATRPGCFGVTVAGRGLQPRPGCFGVTACIRGSHHTADCQFATPSGVFRGYGYMNITDGVANPVRQSGLRLYEHYGRGCKPRPAERNQPAEGIAPGSVLNHCHTSRSYPTATTVKVRSSRMSP